ncbi:Spo0E family sporulation regulatory protein-aspartic acid phosphatase [Ammoniphilus sp. YIM 78166]|uniref:Spo0E family sporulation regulatory protein-aspartic acid phosphatase n=1 Tax=Ammoniphilus sp. YIM 78166 TaxID=1644106 RepID=UPI0010705080|nr:Spo0E family sporulation regulatory protein-aspartic acid phosphatase [Ammoniphilus sp. YIM 78166]
MGIQVVDEQAVLDSLQLEIQLLQEKMYEAVSRLGSFTHPQVVSISVDIDKRVLAFQRILAQR